MNYTYTNSQHEDCAQNLNSVLGVYVKSNYLVIDEDCQTIYIDCKRQLHILKEIQFL